ncbi:MAG: 2'-5' RNA ligase family protein [Micromonosporaceae bacterium]
MRPRVPDWYVHHRPDRPDPRLHVLALANEAPVRAQAQAWRPILRQLPVAAAPDEQLHMTLAQLPYEPDVSQTTMRHLVQSLRRWLAPQLAPVSPPWTLIGPARVGPGRSGVALEVTCDNEGLDVLTTMVAQACNRALAGPGHVDVQPPPRPHVGLATNAAGSQTEIDSADWDLLPSADIPPTPWRITRLAVVAVTHDAAARRLRWTTHGTIELADPGEADHGALAEEIRALLTAADVPLWLPLPDHPSGASVDTCPEGVMIRWLDADYMREDGQRTPELQLAEDRQHDLLRGILHDAGHTTSTYRYPGLGRAGEGLDLLALGAAQLGGGGPALQQLEQDRAAPARRRR